MWWQFLFVLVLLRILYKRTQCRVAFILILVYCLAMACIKCERHRECDPLIRVAAALRCSTLNLQIKRAKTNLNCPHTHKGHYMFGLVWGVSSENIKIRSSHMSHAVYRISNTEKKHFSFSRCLCIRLRIYIFCVVNCGGSSISFRVM